MHSGGARSEVQTDSHGELIFGFLCCCVAFLRGARPEDIPTEQPTTFELILNLKAANVLGIAVPPHY